MECNFSRSDELPDAHPTIPTAPTQVIIQCHFITAENIPIFVLKQHTNTKKYDDRLIILIFINKPIKKRSILMGYLVNFTEKYNA